MTRMTGVSASVLPGVLPLDKTLSSSHCPTSHESPAQAYGFRSKTLDKRNSSLVFASSSSSTSVSDSCRFNISRDASFSGSARSRCFSRQQTGGVSSQFQPLSYSSRQFKREWEKRCGSPQERLRVVADRTMKFQQLFRNAVFSSSRCFSRPLPRGVRQLQVLTHSSRHSRRESRKRCRAEQEKLRMVPERVMKREKQPKFTTQSLNASGNGRSLGKRNWSGQEMPVGKRNLTQGCLKDLDKRLSSEDSEQEVRIRAKKARRDLKMPKPTAGFSFYEFLKECDRTWERRILGDRRDRLEKQWGEENRWEENEYNSLTTSTTIPEKKKAPKYPQTDAPVVHLRNKENGAEVYIIGTSHVSRKSVDHVREIIERVKPNYVLVELCRKRYGSLELRKYGKKFPYLEQIAGTLTKGSASALAKLLGAALAGFSKVQPHNSAYPGQEFQVAMEEGKRVGAKIVLGDQDIDKTLMLLGDFDLNMSVEEAFRLFGQPMPMDVAQALGTGQDVSKAEMLERFKDRKVVRRFNEEMQKGAPHIHKILVDDRNEIMAKSLRSLPGKVVAVVGLAHVDGLEQLWHEYNDNC